MTAGGLAVAHPGLITVGAYDSSTFEVVVRGDNRMAEGSRSITITARVTSASGMPCTTCPSVQSSVMATIMQFSRLRVEAEEPFKQLRPNVDYIFEDDFDLGDEEVDDFGLSKSQIIKAKIVELFVAKVKVIFKIIFEIKIGCGTTPRHA